MNLLVQVPVITVKEWESYEAGVTFLLHAVMCTVNQIVNFMRMHTSKTYIKFSFNILKVLKNNQTDKTATLEGDRRTKHNHRRLQLQNRAAHRHRSLMVDEMKFLLNCILQITRPDH